MEEGEGSEVKSVQSIESRGIIKEQGTTPITCQPRKGNERRRQEDHESNGMGTAGQQDEDSRGG
jgi:hypothetical protein